MGNEPDSATSATLLKLLCGPEQDEAGWQRFCQRYEPLIRGWCARWHLQEADVEDVCQTVLERVFKRINSYDPSRGRFRGWLKTVVENAVRDFLRGRGRRPGDQGSGESDIADLLQAIAQPETVDALIEELDTSLRCGLEAILARVEASVEPDTMRAFRLVFLEGREIKDVAAELGKSYAAVCMAIQRVKTKLRAEGARLTEPPRPHSEGEP
jgi:RNA polymerase sigma-70 factor (ECF subfamily)